MDELTVKTERIVEMLQAERIDGLLINAQHNFAWTTCGGNNGVDQSRENGVASLLFAADGRRFVLANNIELPRMLAEQLPGEEFEPIEYSWQEEKAKDDLIVELAREIAGKSIVSDVSLHSSTPAIESKVAALRFELTNEEKTRYRTLGGDVANSLRKTICTIQPGQSELHIAERMRHELGNVNAAAVVTLVAADERIAKFRHPVPTENRWQKTLMLVVCAKRDGLIVNITRMVCFGEVPSELKDRTDAAAFVNAKLWSATKVGTRSDELYFVARDAYHEVGFGSEIDLHHQGGATGYRTRDWVAHPLGKDVVVRDQAFAWNPSITGTKVEETVLLNDDGIELLTTSPDFPIITHSVDGIEYAAPGILSI